MDKDLSNVINVLSKSTGYLIIIGIAVNHIGTRNIIYYAKKCREVSFENWTPLIIYPVRNNASLEFLTGFTIEGAWIE